MMSVRSGTRASVGCTAAAGLAAAAAGRPAAGACGGCDAVRDAHAVPSTASQTAAMTRDGLLTEGTASL